MGSIEKETRPFSRIPRLSFVLVSLPFVVDVIIVIIALVIYAGLEETEFYRRKGGRNAVSRSNVASPDNDRNANCTNSTPLVPS